MSKATRTPTTPAVATQDGDAPPAAGAAARTTRRGLLGGAALTVATAVLPVAAVLAPDPVWGSGVTPDAELIRLCAAFYVAHTAVNAAEDQEAIDRHLTTLLDVQERVQAMRAATPAGLVAKARLAAFLVREEHGDVLDADDAMVLAVLDNMLDPALAASLPVPPHPDQALLDACAQVDSLERQRADHATPDDVEDALAATQQQWIDRLCSLRATTLDGMRARASTLRLYAESSELTEAQRHSGYVDARMMAALVCDLTGEGWSHAEAMRRVRVLPVGSRGIGDAELHAACAEVIALQHRIDAVWADKGLAGNEKAQDAARAPFEAAQEEHLERICELRATTPAGLKARVRAILAWDKNPVTDDPGKAWNDRMMGALLRDLAGGAAA